MRKKLLAAIVGAGGLMTMPVFALSIDLNLFAGGLSVLDSLLLLGLGLVLLGVLFLCIAFFKPDKESADEPEEFFHQLIQEEVIEEEPAEEPEEELLEEEIPEVLEETEEEIPAEEESNEVPVEEETEEISVEEPIEEETAPEEEPEEEPDEERNYPTLTLTGINHEDFKVLPLKERVTLGRRPDNDLVFTDTTVSGSHCAITVEEDAVFLCDLGSTNGTYLNTKRLSEKTEIHKGDVIALGQLEFRISI
ncbi:MAG: FHA domain-containing protein [Clostridia bacterium]|nr:FHA domain-containing protein [Clostridia bacterium]